MKEDIEITSFTKKDLKKALENNTFWSHETDYIPFSKSKASWLLKNNRIEDDDICAILGFESNQLIAFVYLIPDIINNDDSTTKVYWSSRWWVHDKHKMSVLPTYIKKLASDSVKNQIITKFIVPETEEYYKKQPFTKFAIRDRYIILFDLNHDFIINKIKPLKHILPVLKIITKISHIFISLINKLKINTKAFTYEYLSSIDNHSWEFIKLNCKNDLVPKTLEYINWQIDNNQYTIAQAENKFPHKCLISSVSHKIYNLNFLVKKENTIIGFISVLIRNNEFVLRYFLTSQEHYNYCVDALIENLIKSKCSILLVDDEKLGKTINNKFSKIFSNKRQIFSLIHNDVNTNLENKFAYQQDGHFA